MIFRQLSSILSNETVLLQVLLRLNTNLRWIQLTTVSKVIINIILKICKALAIKNWLIMEITRNITILIVLMMIICAGKLPKGILNWTGSSTLSINRVM